MCWCHWKCLSLLHVRVHVYCTDVHVFVVHKLWKCIHVLSSKKNCCWWLMFQQPEQSKSSSGSSELWSYYTPGLKLVTIIHVTSINFINRCIKSLSCHCPSLLCDSSDCRTWWEIWHSYSQVPASAKCSDATAGSHLCRWLCSAVCQRSLGISGSEWNRTASTVYYQHILDWEKSDLK